MYWATHKEVGVWDELFFGDSGGVVLVEARGGLEIGVGVKELTASGVTIEKRQGFGIYYFIRKYQDQVEFIGLDVGNLEFKIF